MTHSRTEDSTMPWGKHQGLRICELPSEYLEWSLRNLHSMGPTLRSAIRLEKEFRTRHGRASTGQEERWEARFAEADTSRVVSVEIVAAAVRAWYRQAAKREHPDRGGTNDGFVSFNRQAGELKEVLAKLGIDV